MNKLSPTEYAYMCIIWEHPEGIESAEIYKQFPQTVGSKSAILHRIFVKGYVRQRNKGRHVEYIPLSTRMEYDQFILNDEINRKMGLNSITALFAAFCGKKHLTNDEKDKLNALIDEIRNENSEVR